jgi:chromosome segregation ATPase
MKISKFFRSKNDTGTFGEDVYFAVDSDKVDFENGQTLKEKMANAELSISSLQTNYELLDNEVEEAKEQIVEINDRVSVVASEISDAKESLAATNSAIINLQTSTNTLNSKIGTLEGQVQNNVTDIASLQEGAVNTEEEITSIKSILAITCRMESTSLTCTLPDNL